MTSSADGNALRLALAGLIALALAMGIGRFAFTPILPMMQADAGLSLGQGGWLASANYLGYLVGALTAGRLAVAPLRLFRLGLAGVAGSTALMAVGTAFGLWLLWRFAAGVASAWVLISTAALALAQLGALRRARLAGVVFAGVGLGIALAGLVCLALGSAGAGSDSAWLWLAAITLAGTIAVWRSLDSSPVMTPTHRDTAAAPVRGELWRLTACYAAFGFGYILPATFLPAQARALVADPAVFGWVWPVFGVAAALSTVLASRFGHEIPRRRLWAGGHAATAAGVMLPLLWNHLLALVLAALLVGGTSMVVAMAAMQEAQAVGGARAHRLMAHMTAGFAVGQLLGPLAVTALEALGLSIESAMWAAALGLLVSGAVLARGSRSGDSVANVTPLRTLRPVDTAVPDPPVSTRHTCGRP